ncbi:hypothetical protein SADUNF_Sadunf19G0008500 [Salix dunnii]|uniref:Uncharacterized protein n=1 Tax=Salix dunnii TaxID=1413687 RepID=A0A835IZT0_9ROSI|nr:hypothetical protein SADUNF_Sadunf19G0008500 [Salix dunnii]
MEPLERGSFHERPSFNQADEPRGDPSQPTNDKLYSPSVNNDVSVNDAQNVVGVRTEPVVQVLEQSNAEHDNLSVDAGRTQVGVQGMEQGEVKGRVCSHLDMENTGEGSVQHVDRIVPPTIDENYNRREATERLVQHGVGASSFGVYGNHNAISTGQQEQNKEVDNVVGDAGTTPTAATMGHSPGRSLEEFSRWLMEDDIDNGTGGVAQPGAGAYTEEVRSIRLKLLIPKGRAGAPTSDSGSPSSRLMRFQGKLIFNTDMEYHTSLTAIISYLCLNCTSRDIVYWNRYSNFLAELFSLLHSKIN